MSRSNDIQSVTVYCASSSYLDPDFHDAARVIGEAIAARGLTLVTGGGSVGLMGEVSKAARAGGARTIGIITEHLMTRELGDTDCDEMIVVNTMRERKKLLESRGDAFVMLPGGVGTYEEFFEILVGRQLREHDKPIGVVNAHGYFNPLVAMVEHGIEHRFIKPAIYELFDIEPDPVVLLDKILNSKPVRLEDEEIIPGA